jgi:hypothetical protein
MITQRFGFTRHLLKAWNNRVYFQLKEMPCRFKYQVRARHSGEKWGLDPKTFGKRLPFIDEKGIQPGNPRTALHCGNDGVQSANLGSAGGAADDTFVHITLADFLPAA